MLLVSSTCHSLSCIAHVFPSRYPRVQVSAQIFANQRGSRRAPDLLPSTCAPRTSICRMKRRLDSNGNGTWHSEYRDLRTQYEYVDPCVLLARVASKRVSVFCRSSRSTYVSNMCQVVFESFRIVSKTVLTGFQIVFNQCSNIVRLISEQFSNRFQNCVQQRLHVLFNQCSINLQTHFKSFQMCFK